jgi:hypothetical protein
MFVLFPHKESEKLKTNLILTFQIRYYLQ